MRDRNIRNVLDPDDRWWTIEQAAEHFGVTVRAMRRTITDEGVTELLGRVDRDELLPAVARRKARTRATRLKPGI